MFEQGDGRDEELCHGGRGLTVRCASQDECHEPDRGAGVRHDQDGDERQDQGTSSPWDRPWFRGHSEEYQDHRRLGRGHGDRGSFAHSCRHQNLRKDDHDEGDQGPHVRLRRRHDTHLSGTGVAR